MQKTLRVRLVRGVEKWEDRKLVEGWKIFSFFSYVFGWMDGKWEVENSFAWLKRKVGGKKM